VLSLTGKYLVTKRTPLYKYHFSHLTTHPCIL
jgi:hypothetical protein